MTFRIMWTTDQTDGGWYKDIDETDRDRAVWNQALAIAPSTPNPILVSVTDLTPPAAVVEEPAG
jgi:hypothetical protein